MNKIFKDERVERLTDIAADWILNVSEKALVANGHLIPVGATYEYYKSKAIRAKQTLNETAISLKVRKSYSHISLRKE